MAELKRCVCWVVQVDERVGDYVWEVFYDDLRVGIYSGSEIQLMLPVRTAIAHDRKMLTNHLFTTVDHRWEGWVGVGLSWVWLCCLCVRIGRGQVLHVPAGGGRRQGHAALQQGPQPHTFNHATVSTA